MAIASCPSQCRSLKRVLFHLHLNSTHLLGCVRGQLDHPFLMLRAKKPPQVPHTPALMILVDLHSFPLLRDEPVPTSAHSMQEQAGLSTTAPKARAIQKEKRTRPEGVFNSSGGLKRPCGFFSAGSKSFKIFVINKTQEGQSWKSHPGSGREKGPAWK